MYFSYFLRDHFRQNVERLDKYKFVLALDGDIIFRYESVLRLIELALKDEQIGAVCGEIQPVGNGYMYLYQEYEYQLGHWLQKSTESTLGNVLCSPGCFSLIRLKSMIGPADLTGQSYSF